MNHFFGFILFTLFLPLAQVHGEDVKKERQGYWYIEIPFLKTGDRTIEFDVSNSSVNRSGEVFLQNDIGESTLKIAIGRKLNKFRLEGAFFSLPYDIEDVHYESLGLPAEVLNRFSSYDDIVTASGRIDYQGAILNIFYDVERDDTRWIPYLGLGVGVVGVEIDSEVNILEQVRYGEGSDTTGIVQLQFGVGYEINEVIDVFANYNRAFFGEFSIDNYSSQGDNVSNLYLGDSSAAIWGMGLRVKIQRRR